ncbi:hypothetical protein FPHYL_13863 [Fusarium phyllophilum]|uniref:Uncharacterized protein n=1 Tax=Fusarium phyllophilum TaxID=47803 RepID=A0A8H5I920_9HYPO|nr:hypothetical protein FPHYL_13863 [Fusarium phyllophilum]
MADPEPKSTPATVTEVADEDDVMILSDDPFNSLFRLATEFIDLQQTVIKLQETVIKLQKTVNEQHKIVDTQQKIIQKLAEQQQGPTGHDQGAAEACDMEN